jgi:adenylate cyclase
MKNYLLLFVIFILFLPKQSVAQNQELIAKLKETAKTSIGSTKIGALNDLVDELLKPEPGKENCLAAKDYAHEAATLSEKANNKVGMAISYEQLTIIYKTLDYQIHYLRWKAKAALLPRGAEMKQQQQQLEKQQEKISNQQQEMERQERDMARRREEAEKIKQEIALLAKDNSANKSLIRAKQLELLEKEAALTETTQEMQIINEEKVKLEAEKEKLALQNKLLEQDAKINELEAFKQKGQKRFLMLIIAAIALLAGVLFNLYKTKTRTAKELADKNVIIEEEKKRSDELLLNILPLETANELKLTGKAVARQYDLVSVLLTDFKDFTIISEKLSPKELVDEIDLCFSAFDNIIAKYGIEKIKTIGDAYLCAHGIPSGEHFNPHDMINAAKEIIAFVEDLKMKRKAEGRIPFSIRIGIHTGPLVAGVVGKTKFAYDIWGDTVNTAARMEQNSEPGKINVSKATYDLVKDKFTFESRGKIEAKNKGEIEMFFLKS